MHFAALQGLHFGQPGQHEEEDKMKIFDIFLTLLLPALILLHLVVAPYTKVEESFNLQATHDILAYGTPFQNVTTSLRSKYDHFEFPGAVPRSFVGAVLLAGFSRPIITIVGTNYSQHVVRAVLGLFNAIALLRFKDGVDKAFGTAAGRWYLLLQASQFHVMFYASRTLPNMFAFGLSTLALREFLPIPPPATKLDLTTKRYRLGIYLLVLAGVIFRAELAILLATNLLYLLYRPTIALHTIIPAGLQSAAIALALTIPIDSYFWQRPIWPELMGFIYNAIQGKSADWGTSPIHAYLSSFLPKLLLNPFILLLNGVSFNIPATVRSSYGLVVPSLAYVAIYSLQGHKEARFIIYVVPPLTACAALAAGYISTHRARNVLYRLATIAIGVSILGSFAISTTMLAISSLNYPGGEALWKLHDLVQRDGAETRVKVHMDVLSCMTGVSLFEQDAPTPPFYHILTSAASSLASSSRPSTPDLPDHTTQYFYDKTEDEATLLTPEFWTQFDYVLAEAPERVIGKWDIIYTAYGYAGLEILRPGAPEPEYEQNFGGSESTDWSSGLIDVLVSEADKHGVEGILKVIRQRTRNRVTRGWWVGPRMRPAVHILKRSP